MPNIKSAIKRTKVIEKKTMQNNMVKSAYKTAVKKFEQAIAEGNVEEAQITTISGDVDFMGSKASRLKIKTTSGEVELRNSEIADLNAATTSGDIEGTFFAEKLSVQSISGDIDMTLDRRGRELIAKTKSVSGDCDVYGRIHYDGTPDPTRHIVGYFSTISGDIEIR